MVKPAERSIKIEKQSCVMVLRPEMRHNLQSSNKNEGRNAEEGQNITTERIQKLYIVYERDGKPAPTSRSHHYLHHNTHVPNPAPGS